MRRHGVSSWGVNMGTSDDGRVNITDGAKVAAVRALLDKA
ncbi:copper homeostasis protein CutC [Aeromonas hydrophila]|nr:copper homeostasis protein CutC [Aeromonas hydrophila]QBX72511.1 copper homeostasis protein CutC [Aeromonas hydrophila]QBX77212.1 copper homeostasis protein CutC [Aeromonas hydrophila]TNH82204.1 copper homeostasis protein CutC [Aeromonas hydrophila]HAU4929096.1 copper homeostasis protein CutC [Aeromonas hydrophila]